jgi:hypothetical protein
MSRSKLALALLLLGALPALAAPAGDDAVAVVQAAYVDGVHRNADADAMRAGFHPSFIMYVNGEDGVTMVKRDDWAARIEKAGADPDRKAPEISADLEVVGLSGDTAVVKVELSRDGKHVFTDFLSLYRTAPGWQIVAKVFRRHP